MKDMLKSMLIHANANKGLSDSINYWKVILSLFLFYLASLISQTTLNYCWTGNKVKKSSKLEKMHINIAKAKKIVKKFRSSNNTYKLLKQKKVVIIS